MFKSIFLISFLFLSFTNSANAYDTPEDIDGWIESLAKSKTIRNTAFQSVLGSRCNSYLSYPYGDACSLVASRMISVLDYDVIFPEGNTPQRPDESWRPSSFLFIAFKKNLISLLSSKTTEKYLNDLNQALNNLMVGSGEKFSFWELTKKHYKSDYMTSMAIAALFQDTSMMKLHLAYLDKSKNNRGTLFASNKDLLSRTILSINWAMDNAETEVKEVFYPEQFSQNLSRRIYHFYVPLYLSMALNKEGYKKDYSALAPLMMTLSYKFITSAKDYRYIFSDPEYIQDRERIKDIYGGYCGANYGVRKFNFNYSFELIRSEFARSTSKGIKTLIRH